MKNKLFKFLKNNTRYRSTDKKRCFIMAFHFTLRRFQFYCANKTVEIVHVKSYIVLCRMNRVIIDRFDAESEKLLLSFCCVASIIDKCKCA